MKRFSLMLVVGAALTLVVAERADAQFVTVAPAPVVSYYVAPSAYYYTPGAYSYSPGVAVSNYVAPAAVYAPSTVVAPAPVYYGTTVTYPYTVNRGLFGRWNVRTPFYRIRY